MTNGLHSATSGLSPAIMPASTAASKRADKNGAAAGGPSFSQVLQQHQTPAAAASAAPIPTKAPASASASSSLTAQPPAVPTAARPEVQTHRAPDQSGARAAERQAAARSADLRQAEVTQQANRDAAARADKAAESRQDNKESSAEKADGEDKSKASGSSDNAQATKPRSAGHLHHAGRGDKPAAAHVKKGAGASEDGDAKAAALARLPGAADAAAAGALPGAAQQPAATTPVTPEQAAAAAADAASGVKAQADVGKAALPTQALAAEASAAAGAAGAGAATALGGKHGLAGHGKPAGEITAGAKLIQSARADAAGKAEDLVSFDAARSAAGMAFDAGYAAAMHAMGADQQSGNGGQGDMARHPGESAMSSKIEGVGGAAGMLPTQGAGAATNALQQAAEPPPPQQLMFATPTTAPEFAAALGVTVSNMAADGVQQAQLHLNPAETGPIQIQITLDGTQAQVDFQAANAQTRDAISAGMPELAAALNAAGLTLTGGGVSEQSRGQSDARDSRGDQTTASRGITSKDTAPSRPRPIITRQPQGAVDLYA